MSRIAPIIKVAQTPNVQPPPAASATPSDPNEQLLSEEDRKLLILFFRNHQFWIKRMMMSIKDNPISPVVQPVDYINQILTRLNDPESKITAEDGLKIKKVMQQYPAWSDTFKAQINQIIEKLKV